MNVTLTTEEASFHSDSRHPCCKQGWQWKSESFKTYKTIRRIFQRWVQFPWFAAFSILPDIMKKTKLFSSTNTNHVCHCFSNIHKQNGVAKFPLVRYLPQLVPITSASEWWRSSGSCLVLQNSFWFNLQTQIKTPQSSSDDKKPLNVKSWLCVKSDEMPGDLAFKYKQLLRGFTNNKRPQNVNSQQWEEPPTGCRNNTAYITDTQTQNIT